jgi:fucose 4-O-acetylase-like acetyltransferase
MRMWAEAKKLSAKTPANRNRYVDFLRAISILAVVTGHWLIVAIHMSGGQPSFSDVLVLQPRTQWLTWLFQVMPVFFIVGGYANAVSLESAGRSRASYAEWLAKRLHRLVSPLLLLLVAWGVLAAVLYFRGVSGEVTSLASRASLIPIWFLAIYIMVVVLAPVTYAAWQRWRFGSFWALCLAAVLVDTAFFLADAKSLAWSNYFWIWLAVHQLGYAWRDGSVGTARHLLAYSAVALVVLVLLVTQGPYPVAMAGSPDDDLSNSLPPKVTLLLLGITQFGLLLAIESPMRRLLSGLRIWAATVLINSMIMTLYLWHLTVMVIVVSVAYVAGGFGFGLEPGTEAWWWTRPVWIACLYLVLMPVTLLLSPLERRPRSPDAPVPSAVRQVGGAMMICLGVALLARYGFGDSPIPWLDIGAFALVVAGAGLSGLLSGRLRRA